MSKVHIPKHLGHNVKAKARHSLRRRESALIKQSCMKKSKTIGKGNYLYKYYLKDFKYGHRTLEDGTKEFGYFPVAPRLVRWNMRGAWKRAKKISNRKIRNTFKEEPLHHSEYKRVFDMAQFY